MGYRPTAGSNQATMGVGAALRSLWLRALLLVCALSLLPCCAFAHPANIPVGRAKVQVDGAIELTFTFDILAFVLDQTPQIVLDAPMNGLLDGPQKDLQDRLTAAQKRFLEGLQIGDAANPGVVDSIDFPTAAQIRQAASEQTPRLPVMMTATFKCHLPKGVRRVSFHFAEVLGPVVLSTEFPYLEPLSESIEPGDSSSPLEIPSAEQVARVEASMHISKPSAKTSVKQPSEAQARKAIQQQYDAWSKAYMAHDVDTLQSILAPGYTLKTAQGMLIKRPEYEVMLNRRKQKHSDTTLYKTEIVRITLKDGIAAIWSRETTTDPGINQATGKAEPVSYQHDYIDLWVHVGEKWLLKGTVTQKEQKLPPK